MRPLRYAESGGGGQNTCATNKAYISEILYHSGIKSKCGMYKLRPHLKKIAIETWPVNAIFVLLITKIQRIFANAYFELKIAVTRSFFKI